MHDSDGDGDGTQWIMNSVVQGRMERAADVEGPAGAGVGAMAVAGHAQTAPLNSAATATSAASSGFSLDAFFSDAGAAAGAGSGSNAADGLGMAGRWLVPTLHPQHDQGPQAADRVPMPPPF